MSSGAISSTGVRQISSNARMVRFDIRPASASPSAASCATASASLLYCLVIAIHLDYRPNPLRRREARPIKRQILVGQSAERLQLVAAQVLPEAPAKP